MWATRGAGSVIAIAHFIDDHIGTERASRRPHSLTASARAGVLMQSELVTSLYTSVHNPGSNPDCLLVCLLSILCSVSHIRPFPLLCGFFFLLCSFLGSQDGTLGTCSNSSASVGGSPSPSVPDPVTCYLPERLGAYCMDVQRT